MYGVQRRGPRAASGRSVFRWRLATEVYNVGGERHQRAAAAMSEGGGERWRWRATVGGGVVLKN